MSTFEIDNVVEQIASKSIIKSFYPWYISKVLELSLDKVVPRLNYLVLGDSIKLKYEIRCDEDSDIIEIVDDYGKYLGNTLYCRSCNEDIEITLENIFPLYYINDEYRECVKKKLNCSNLNINILSESEAAIDALNIEGIVRNYFMQQNIHVPRKQYLNINELDENLGQLTSALAASGDKQLLDKFDEIDELVGNEEVNKPHSSMTTVFNQTVNSADKVGKLYKGYEATKHLLMFTLSKWNDLAPYIKPLKTFFDGLFN
ncbi:hypothetical protein [Clostridium sp. FP1]|uniref:hypothetical protein n=1 Tax=Clostridium sp. FP1 TaxID=2724076 RepID=UPI0013E911B8|nr:hypothetical protein [Clostridium sp. FP1]MBZ9635567.1 hypothetical protein [Clostridium sp. FP1]